MPYRAALCNFSRRYCVPSKRGASAASLSCFRPYHSEGDFGYKRKTHRTYEVPKEQRAARNKQSNLFRLMTAYRKHGHKQANINPIALTKPVGLEPELELERYGLNAHDEVVFTDLLLADTQRGSVQDAVEILHRAYCRTMTAEFVHLDSEVEREWFAERMERAPTELIDKHTKLRVAKDLIVAQTLDQFVAKKFVSLKRYGGEGAESMMAFFSEMLKIAAKDDLEQIVLCLPHRGRANVLTGHFGLSPAKLFRAFKGLKTVPDDLTCSCDVASHLISSVDLDVDDKNIHVTVLYNPSHLEAVNPLSMGKTRSKQMATGDGDYGADDRRFSDKILNVQIHGDAAFAGQGINQEMLAFTALPHFEIGGTVHLIVNNQIGFTTPSDRGRSSRYCSDIAKSIAAPVIHVNGDYPEDVLKATRIAMDYQRAFRKDVFIDMNCFRRWGHNELDDPTFTNPAVYSIIHSKTSVPDAYAKQLQSEGVLTEFDVNDIAANHEEWLNDHLQFSEAFKPEVPCFERQWSGFELAPAAVTTWDTGVHPDILTFVGSRSVSYPVDFNIHPHLLKTYVKNRLSKVAEGTNIDWATAEALAIGSLLYEGHNVRISGQDVGRGTFSHRHAMLVDQKTNQIYIPLNKMNVAKQGFFEVANSILSEEAVLGFEYGMSIDNPNNLIIWEAQFGDFFNGAQIIFDTFISNGEMKWLTSSGLVVLLPHGLDGAGPEHSSCKMERFLQLTDSNETTPDGDDVNMQVVYPTTPAQYFHLLRRQIVRNFRKPLIVVGPKTMIRLPAATSTFYEMAPGTHFQPVLGDNSVDPLKVKRIILVSGKHYYELVKQREVLGLKDVAIIRLEGICPFPIVSLQNCLNKFTNAKEFIWSQEEPRNMGAWSFVKPRFENLLGHRLKYVGRKESAIPGVGIAAEHKAEVKEVITLPFM